MGITQEQGLITLTPIEEIVYTGYTDAAVWAECPEESACGKSIRDWTPDDLTPETQEAMRREVHWFVDHAWHLLDAIVEKRAPGCPLERAYQTLEQAGHDLWLTRRGHGAGFWDGGWPEDTEGALDALAKQLGDIELLELDGGTLGYMVPEREPESVTVPA